MSAVSVEVPEGCSLSEVVLQAETEAAYNVAVKQFGLTEYGPISNTRERNGKHTAYKYRLAGGMTEGCSVLVRGPKHEMKLVPA